MLGLKRISWFFALALVPLGVASGCGQSERKQPPAPAGTGGTIVAEAGMGGEPAPSTGGSSGTGTGTGGTGGAGTSGGGESGSGDASTPMTALERCHLLGSFRINATDPTPTCPYGPQLDGFVTIAAAAGRADAAAVSVGAYTLSAVLESDCVLSADTCAQTTDPSGYIEAALHVEPIDGGITGWFEGLVMEGNRVEDCESSTSFIAALATGKNGATTTLPFVCEFDRPFVCGDGVCDAENGEGCKPCLEDCGCADEEKCFGTGPGKCGKSCSVWDPGGCGDGQRCDFQDDGTMHGASSRTVCAQAGELGYGERCLANSRCAPGLFCFEAQQWPGNYGTCLPPCSSGHLTEEVPSCGGVCADFVRSEPGFFGACQIPCELGVEGSCKAPNTFCWNDFGAAAPVCTAVPESGVAKLGEVCETSADPPACEPNLNCVPVCDDCDLLCTLDCSAGDPCPDALPICSETLGVCVPTYAQ